MSNAICVDDRGRIQAADYHETLMSGVEAWWAKLTTEAAEKGWGRPEIALEDVSVQPMDYETNQRIHVVYVPEATDKPSRKAGHSLMISIYRLPSGRYEFTAYNS
jgi:hypothetical protein